MPDHLGPEIGAASPERELAHSMEGRCKIIASRVSAWAPALTLGAAVLLAADAGRAPLVRRLTHSQYNNTVRDLLGDQTRPADSFPQEDYVNGFKNQIAAQDISPLQAEAYHAAALKLAKAAFQGGDDPRH